MLSISELAYILTCCKPTDGKDDWNNLKGLKETVVEHALYLVLEHSRKPSERRTNPPQDFDEGEFIVASYAYRDAITDAAAMAVFLSGAPDDCFDANAIDRTLANLAEARDEYDKKTTWDR